jgi:amino acid permease
MAWLNLWTPGSYITDLLTQLVISSVISCLGEMTALMPVNAPVMEFPRRFVSRAIGFAVGWIYWLEPTPIHILHTSSIQTHPISIPLMSCVR